MIVIAPCGSSLVAWPILSANGAYLVAAARDTFTFFERPNRSVAFRRDSSGGVVALTRVGTDRWMNRADTTLGVIDLLLSGQTTAAAARVPLGDSAAVAAAVALGSRIGDSHPSLRPAMADFLSRLRSTVPPRKPTPSIDTGYWGRAIDLDRVFRPPTAAEMRSVRADWKRRAVSPSDVREVYRTSLAIGGTKRVGTVIGFTLGALREYGVVFLPVSRDSSCCAIIVDIKGTTPDYQPLDFSSLPRSVRELGAAADSVMIVFPGIRGERITIGDTSFVSDGNRANGWDGGADDARAALGAAESLYRLPDTTRVCALGHSRGATVALLAAERDRRFSCVVAEAAPVDWFSLMSEGDRSLPDAVREGLALRSRPGEIGGQFIERFLAPVRDSGWTLAQVRRRMLASSPLYFTALLPPTLAIYGADDASVPLPNGDALAGALRGWRGSRVRIQSAVGHDLDPVETPAIAGDFLRRALGLGSQRR